MMTVDQNNHGFIALLFSISSLLLFVFSVGTSLLNETANTVNGFQLFVIPLALLSLFIALKGRKEAFLYENEKKRLKQAIILSSMMIALPIVTYVIIALLN